MHEQQRNVSKRSKIQRDIEEFHVLVIILARDCFNCEKNSMDHLMDLIQICTVIIFYLKVFKLLFLYFPLTEQCFQ